MDTGIDQFLRTAQRHRVALGGLAVAVMLGALTGNALKPSGMLDEPMAAQLIASEALASNSPPPVVLEAFPTNTENRPWVAGTDSARMAELQRLNAAYGYEEAASSYEEDTPMALPHSTPSVDDRAVDAVAQEDFVAEPSA